MGNSYPAANVEQGNHSSITNDVKEIIIPPTINRNLLSKNNAVERLKEICYLQFYPKTNTLLTISKHLRLFVSNSEHDQRDVHSFICQDIILWKLAKKKNKRNSIAYESKSNPRFINISKNTVHQLSTSLHCTRKQNTSDYHWINRNSSNMVLLRKRHLLKSYFRAKPLLIHPHLQWLAMYNISNGILYIQSFKNSKFKNITNENSNCFTLKLRSKFKKNVINSWNNPKWHSLNENYELFVIQYHTYIPRNIDQNGFGNDEDYHSENKKMIHYTLYEIPKSLKNRNGNCRAIHELVFDSDFVGDIFFANCDHKKSKKQV